LSPRTATGVGFVDIPPDTILRRPNLRRVFLINHIAKERKSLLVRHGHRDTGQFNLQLSFRRGEEVRLYFINEHMNLHGI
jgi:hypothetical protein